ncbi:MAG TPA: TlpA disulfide reductase family protein [Pseudobacter sp.]|nr:TlpA disulfide reductase family protein [Pseudobacter sp.]
MKKGCIILSLLLSLLAGAQTRFTINGTIELPDSTSISLVTLGSKSVVIQKARVKNGKFLIAGEVKEVMMANLMVFYKSAMITRTVYLEEGPIQVNAGKKLETAKVKAGSLNRQWDEWQGSHGAKLIGLDISEVTGFAKKYPASPLSLDLFVYDEDRRHKFYPVFNTLDASVQELGRAKRYRASVESDLALQLGHIAPDFTVNDPEGKSWKLSDYRGQYVLLDFWASWCKPCRAAVPELRELYNKYKDKGFMILGVSIDDNANNWVNAIKTDNSTWKHGSDLKGNNGEVARLYKLSFVPQVYLLDPEGKIIAGNDYEKVLAERLGNQ